LAESILRNLGNGVSAVRNLSQQLGAEKEVAQGGFNSKCCGYNKELLVNVEASAAGLETSHLKL